ncbi:MAG: secretion protein HlyD [Rhodobacteraceae bacterium]|nr:secretion protein HlyD [Paracoccaceae bacterium]MBR27472.1 secretion protein HlyD [Paracoccaceae bacterium]
MLEFTICATLTILPDYLFRRYVQGKRWGHELTLFTIWTELRWGLTLCAILTLSLITMIFYHHPTTTRAVAVFRTVAILPESGGRVAEIGVVNEQQVKAGDMLFRLDDSRQRAEVESARRKVSEIDAAQTVAQSELAAAIGQVDSARSSLEQAQDELNRSTELSKRNSNVVSARELERLQNVVNARQGALSSAIANQGAVEAKISTLLPAQKASAEAALDQAEVMLDKTIVRAGIDGKLEQFALRVGDYVSAVLRPAGLLIPDDVGGGRVVANFDQVSAQVLEVGMVGEVACLSTPFDIIPTVITDIQSVIAEGQFRPTDFLAGEMLNRAPGGVTVFMEPLYKEDAALIIPGSHCVANAYSSFHQELENEDLPTGRFMFYHAVDATALVHAAILRIAALRMPVETLVLSGH